MGITRTEKRNLEKEITNILSQMEVVDKGSKEYTVLSENLERLLKMKESKHSITPDTILIVAANLLGIILILNHEHLNVVSSKAIGFVMKGRV